MKWVGIFIIVGAILLIAISVFNIPVYTVVTGALLLACPLIHMAMMRNGGHKH